MSGTPEKAMKEEVAKYKERKVALITGITGQDGSYLAELLLSKGYQVHGMIRRSATPNTMNIAHLVEKESPTYAPSLHLHHGDMTDSSSLTMLLLSVQPTEIYNLAAQSHGAISFEVSEYTAEVDAVGVLRLLNAIRACGLEKKVRLYQASTSELFGKVEEMPQRETTPFKACSPYGIAKLFAHTIVVNYREAYGMFCANGILFNHESPRRGESFVTRKITRSVAKIHLGLQELIELGNLDAKCDWGHARDYVEAMWLMLQQEAPDDFVVASEATHTVREFVTYAFEEIGREIEWRGEGVHEEGVEKRSGVVRVRVNPKFFRPLDLKLRLGDASKAKQALGWSIKTPLAQLVKEMMLSDIELEKKNFPA